MNAIVPRAAGTGLISREELAKSLNNASMSMPSVGSNGLQFLKMDKNTGEWIYGQEETLVEADSHWALNPASIKHGWVAWDTNAGGAPVQEVMVPINRPLPDVNGLVTLPMSTPDKKGNVYQLMYQQQYSAEFTAVDGEDEGTTVEYKQSSVGAMKLFGSLINTLLDQATKSDEIVALGLFKGEPYKHSKYGRIFNPIFEIVEWRTMDDNSAPAAEEAAEPEKPAARTRTAAAAAPTTSALTPEQEEEALAKEYEATQAAQGGEATPRRRVRR